MNKTALLRNIILADIWRDAGVAVIDPHGDLAEDVIDSIPPERSGDVVYFNPSDIEFPSMLPLLSSPFSHVFLPSLLYL
jgi:hypothetical protein